MSRRKRYSRRAKPRQPESAVLSGYEAANPSIQRTSFWSFPLQGRYEIDTWTRIEVLRKIRALEANCGIPGRIASQIGKYAVGKGIMPLPATTDAEWNKLRKESWEEWAMTPMLVDVTGAMDFYEMQKWIVENTFAEGETMTALVKQGGDPSLQLLEVATCQSGYGESDWVDGVKLNAAGRAMSYRFCDPTTQKEVYTVPAANLIHLWRKKRVGQVRGLSTFYAGVNSLIDVLDTVALEKGAAKLHASLALAVKKKGGTAGRTGISGKVNELLGPDGKPDKLAEKFWAGAAIAYLEENEEIDLLSSDRPGANLLDFLRFLIREIAVAVGLPYEVVWDMAQLGGATARAMLEDAQWLFDWWGDLLAWRWCRRVYVWKTALDIESGRIRPCTDPNWWRCNWQGPRKITVDAGYSSQNALNEIGAGLATHEEFWAARGGNAREAVQQQIEFYAWAMAECEAKGVPFEFLFGSLARNTPGLVMTPTQEETQTYGK
jgi:lambda family phage portal protein